MELFAEVDDHLSDFRLLDLKVNHFLRIRETRSDDLDAFRCDDDLEARHSCTIVSQVGFALTFSFESNLYDPMRIVRQEKLVE